MSPASGPRNRQAPLVGSRRGRTAFAVTVAVSLVMLFTPSDGVPSADWVNDKVVHGALFAALAATGRLAGVRTLPLALSLAAYAGASELLQSALPLNRHGDVLDALADVTGLLLGLVVVALSRRDRRVDP